MKRKGKTTAAIMMAASLISGMSVTDLNAQNPSIVSNNFTLVPDSMVRHRLTSFARFEESKISIGSTASNIRNQTAGLPDPVQNADPAALSETGQDNSKAENEQAQQKQEQDANSQETGESGSFEEITEKAPEQKPSLTTHLEKEFEASEFESGDQTDPDNQQGDFSELPEEENKEPEQNEPKDPSQEDPSDPSDPSQKPQDPDDPSGSLDPVKPDDPDLPPDSDPSIPQQPEDSGQPSDPDDSETPDPLPSRPGADNPGQDEQDPPASDSQDKEEPPASPLPSKPEADNPQPSESSKPVQNMPQEFLPSIPSIADQPIAAAPASPSVPVVNNGSFSPGTQRTITVKSVSKRNNRKISIGNRGTIDLLPNFGLAAAWKDAKSPYNSPSLWGQCTWFAWGRFYEMYGFDPGFSGNGFDCVTQLLAAHGDQFEFSDKPAAGAVFSSDTSHNHVGIVLEYDEKTDLLTIQEGNLDGISNPSWAEAIEDYRTIKLTSQDIRTLYGNVTYAVPREGTHFVTPPARKTAKMSIRLTSLKDLSKNTIKQKVMKLRLNSGI